LVVEAIASLAAARLILARQPFSRVAAKLGTFSAAGPVLSQEDLPARGTRVAREIGWAVRAAAPWMPFRAVCLEQAIAARAMLRRRGIPSALHLGAGPDESHDLAAHAWLDAGGAKVTGYPVAPNIVEIGCFT
jgi:transglutaminase-like putative cysteine protease